MFLARQVIRRHPITVLAGVPAAKGIGMSVPGVGVTWLSGRPRAPAASVPSTVTCLLRATSSQSSRRVHSEPQWQVADKLATSPRCDPYGLGGRCLTQKQCEELMATVDSQWSLSSDVRHLSRTFRGAHVNKLRDAAVAIGERDGHQVSSLDASPKQLVIVLHTPALRGLSHEDFLLALKLDGVAASLSQHNVDTT